MQLANAPVRPRLHLSPRRSTRDACLHFVLGAPREVHPDEVARGISRSVEVVGPALTELKNAGLLQMRVGPHPEGRGPGVLLYRAAAPSPAAPSTADGSPELPRARSIIAVPSPERAPSPPPEPAREVARRAVAATGSTKLTEAVYAIVRAASAPITSAQIAALLPDGLHPNSVSPTVTKLIALGRIAPVVVGPATRARRYVVAGHPLTHHSPDASTPPPPAPAPTTPGRARWRDRRIAGAPLSTRGPRRVALVDLVYGVIAGARSPLSVLEIVDLMPPGVGATSVSPTVSKLVAMGRILPVLGAPGERCRRYVISGPAAPLSVRTARARRPTSPPPPVASGAVEAALLNAVRILGPVTENTLRSALRTEYPMRDLRLRLEKLVDEGVLAAVTTTDGLAYTTGGATLG